MIEKKQIESLIERYRRTYIDNPSIMLSGYRQEKQTVADYNGRQLLELIQNADDAKSDVVYIKLDTEQELLTISNVGNGFSIDGVESLMYTGLTTKNKSEYIGNKGLGFRAVLNWADWVEVRTKGVSFRFSKEYSVSFYHDELLKHRTVEEKVRTERDERRLEQNEIPIATLAFPKITDNKTNYETSIVLKYKNDYLPSIKEQLEHISEEILLFLPNVETIKYENGDIAKVLKKETTGHKGLVDINGSRWNIFRSEENEYDKLKFNYAIAWKDDLKEQGKFYTYFPTDVSTNLPSFIHATFDLTNNRKEINNSDDNKYILEQIISSLAEITENKIKNKSNPNWNAYRFLTTCNRDNRKVLDDFYKLLRDKREEIGVYPTVDGKYVTKNEVFYHGSSFSAWVEENELGDFFPNLMKAPNLSMNVDCSNLKKYDKNDFIEHISYFTEVEFLELEKRIELISLIVKNVENFHKVYGDIKLPLLIDRNGKIASVNKRVFTHGDKISDIKLPKYIDDISFISLDLYDGLKKSLSDEIKNKRIDGDSGDSRAIKRILDPYVNIGSDDITDVIQLIVSQTNTEIKEGNPREIIVEMISSLYSIFSSNKDRRGNLTTIQNIPLLTRSGNIKNSDSLYFGDDYLGNSVESLIFDGVRSDDDYLAPYSNFGIEGDNEDIYRFFAWLNVNRYSRYEEKAISKNLWENDAYTTFVLETVNGEVSNCHKIYNRTKIIGLDEYLKNIDFSIEKLIAWIAKDERFLGYLSSGNNDYFKTEYNRNTTTLKDFPSYIKYTIMDSGILDNVVLSKPLVDIASVRFLDDNHVIFKKLGIPDYKVKEIAVALNMKLSFNELSPNTVYEILKVRTGKEEVITQQEYKFFYDYFKANEDTQLKNYKYNFEDLHYYARKGGIGSRLELQPVDNVYYSDNKILPQKLLNKYWILNLQRRAGENQVKKFFGVKLIKDLIKDLRISDVVPNDAESELNRHLASIKPYILAYRLETLQNENEKREAARAIDSLVVKLVEDAVFQFNNEEIITFDNYDSIYKDNEFYIKFEHSLSVERLQNDPLFCDVIAEMYCIVFKVNDLKNVFRRIFKDGFVESKHILESDEKTNLLEKAKELLGISDSEKRFWQSIFKEKSYKIGEVKNDEEFVEIIEQTIQAKLPECYRRVNFSDITDENGVKLLKWLYDSTILSPNLADVLGENGLVNYHKRKLEDKVRGFISTFEKHLWYQANVSKDIKLKKDYYRQIITFDNSVADGRYVNFCEKNKYQLYPDYDVAIYDFVEEEYKIDLQSFIEDVNVVDTRYDDLISNYSFGDSVEDIKKILQAKDIEIYSLLYFDGYNEKVKEALEEERINYEEEVSNDVNDTIFDVSKIELFETSIERRIVGYTTNNNRNRIGSAVTSKSNRRKARAGKREEEKVYQVLKHNGYEVRHVSKKTDSKHYDIEYKSKEDSVWRFLEVKKDSGGYFYLSKAEKDTALSKDYTNRYDIAIVSDTEVRIVKGLFDFEEESFENNSKFYAEPTEFIISFDIKDNKQEKC